MTHARCSVGWTKSDGRAGPDGETLHVGLSCPPAVHPNRLWWWTYKVQEKENGDGIEEERGEAYLVGDGWGHARVWAEENRVREALNIGHVGETSRIQFMLE